MAYKLTEGSHALRDPTERFWAKVDKSAGPEACWPWMASRFKQTGYGVFHPAKPVTMTAHKYAYENTYGPVPSGMVLDHTCHNGTECPPGPCEHRACCNPAHLEAVTGRTNGNRSHNGNINKTHCPKGHEYTPGNTRIHTKSGGSGRGRSCRACATERERNRRRTA